MFRDQDGSHSTRRGSGVSLFRPGQQVNSPPVTLDLATGRDIFSHDLPALIPNPARVWESLVQVQVSDEILAGNGLFPTASDTAAGSAFDHLRSRVLMGLEQTGWRRIAVTSPTQGCGKSFVAANLALSLARRPGSRSVLIDLDLRHPGLAALWGQAEAPALEEFLSADQPLESVFRRHGRTLALGLNGAPASPERLHDPATLAALTEAAELLDPEVVIYDLPPALAGDDILALAPAIDAVLLVTDGTRTTPDEIRACERLLEGRLPLLGVVLNRAQDRSATRHVYGKR